REVDERGNDLFGVVACGARVPQPQGGEPVGVDVLRGALELGEGGDGAPRVARAGVVDLEKERLVGLDDERTVRHGVIVPRAQPPVTVTPIAPSPAFSFLPSPPAPPVPLVDSRIPAHPPFSSTAGSLPTPLSRR